ncbi:MAG: hypothetical protein J6Q54_03290 [Oscillospiraceae bacterium]|nr:hypothetical protein [Oscillospiraceae bacterium]
MENVQDHTFCNSYLRPGEQILWRGRPEKGNYLTSRDIILIPFSIFWCGFALFWEFSAMQSGIGFMSFFGLPFVAIGLYMVFGRFLHAAYLRDKTQYVITNKKLIIKKGQRITIYTRNDLPPMTLQIHKNGNGTIEFTETLYGYGRRAHHSYFALVNLRDPIGAQEAINAME